MNDSKHQLFDCQKCLFHAISNRFISDTDFNLIRKTSVQLTYKKGEVIYKQGAKCSSILFLHKGIVKFSYEHEDGRKYITTIVKGPKLLGGANLFFNEVNIFSIIAVEDCEACEIDIRALRTVVVKDGRFLLALCEQAAAMFQSSIFNFLSLAHKQVYGRIADVLIYLWEQVYQNSGYEFNLSRKEIAEFAACSHENVITTLSKYKNEGVIRLEGKSIIIDDLEKLKAISKNG
jgi:CRP/FNR family transcriptional regulator, polysaccharide utilization system transcription regulator